MLALLNFFHHECEQAHQIVDREISAQKWHRLDRNAVIDSASHLVLI